MESDDKLVWFVIAILAVPMMGMAIIFRLIDNELQIAQIKLAIAQYQQGESK